MVITRINAFRDETESIFVLDRLIGLTSDRDAPEIIVQDWLN